MRYQYERILNSCGADAALWAVCTEGEALNTC